MTNRYAIIVMQAPLMSFGTVAVDERRPTDQFPGLSMITGLIGNALGWHRRDHPQLRQLQQRIRYATRIERMTPMPGDTVLTELQTAEVSPDDVAWTTRGVPERRGGERNSYRGPILKRMEYVVESRAVSALRLNRANKEPTLDRVAEALQWPARTLCIGRRACIPETMLFDGFVEADNAVAALGQVTLEGWRPTIQWDVGEEDDNVRHNRERWTYDIKDWANGVHVGRRTVRQGRPRLAEREGQ